MGFRGVDFSKLSSLEDIKSFTESALWASYSIDDLSLSIGDGIAIALECRSYCGELTFNDRKEMLSTDADADTCECVSALLLYGSNASTADEVFLRTGLFWLTAVFDSDDDEFSDEPVDFWGSGGSASKSESNP